MMNDFLIKLKASGNYAKTKYFFGSSKYKYLIVKYFFGSSNYKYLIVIHETLAPHLSNTITI